MWSKGEFTAELIRRERVINIESEGKAQQTTPAVECDQLELPLSPLGIVRLVDASPEVSRTLLAPPSSGEDSRNPVSPHENKP